MSSPADAVSVLTAEQRSRDWRIERLRSLMGPDWLAGEWDRDAGLILPVPGGRLHGIRRCVVAGCPRDGHWNH